MLPGIEQRAAVVARDDLRPAQPSGAVTADVGDRSRWNVEDVTSGLQAAGKVDVLIPELEVLVPPSDRRERLSPDDETGARRLVDDGRLALAQPLGRTPATGEHCDEGREGRKRLREVFGLGGAVLGVDQPSGRGDRAGMPIQRTDQQPQRLLVH